MVHEHIHNHAGESLCDRNVSDSASHSQLFNESLNHNLGPILWTAWFRHCWDVEATRTWQSPLHSRHFKTTSHQTFSGAVQSAAGVLVPLGAAAGCCECCLCFAALLLPRRMVLVSECCPRIPFAIWGLCWRNYFGRLPAPFLWGEYRLRSLLGNCALQGLRSMSALREMRNPKSQRSTAK